MSSEPRPTRSQVDAAGRLLRRQRLGEPVSLPEVDRALGVLASFRSGWIEPPRPLTKVNVGLRSMVSTAVRAGEVSQRLKRSTRIVEKLARQPTMALSTMQDVGGCRVVVPTLEDLRTIERRIEEVWGDSVVRRLSHDYVAAPKDDGYRAVHHVVRRDDHLVEIQLRTELQHRWATAVERLEDERQDWVRGMHGDLTTTSALRRIAEALAFVDRGQAPPDELRAWIDLWLRQFGSAM